MNVILMAFPPLLTALAVVREREQGSIRHIYMSPIRAWEFFLGKLIPYALIAFVEMLLLLAAAVWWFEVPVRGSVWLLLAMSVLYVVAACGIGLVVSTAYSFNGALWRFASARFRCARPPSSSNPVSVTTQSCEARISSFRACSPSS